MPAPSNGLLSAGAGRTSRAPAKLRGSLLGAIAAGGFAFAAFALTTEASGADLPSTKSPPPSPLPAFTWTGFYVGLNTGYSWTNSSNIGVASANIFDFGGPLSQRGAASAFGATGSVGAQLNGFFDGGQIGYNWQFSEKFVAGLEADLQGGGVRGGGGFTGLTPAATPIPSTVVTGATVHRNLEYLGTVRGRIGYTIAPQMLLYATGGLAYGGVNLSEHISQSITPSLLLGQDAKGSYFDNRVGWTAGAGFEWAFTNSLSVKLEYLYYDLGAVRVNNSNIGALYYTTILGGLAIDNATAASTQYNGHIVRAGLNYRFDAGQGEGSVSGATPLFTAPKLQPAPHTAFGDWRFSFNPYNWGVNFNGATTAAGLNLGVDASLVDFLTKTSSFPLSFMGRFEATNGPVQFYGDVAWMQLKFAGSQLALRNPVGDLGLALSASGRLKETLAIGEAGGAYELARWRIGDSGAFTAIDAFAGLRYWYVGLDVRLDAFGAANSQLVDFQALGALAASPSGKIQWIDPVVGLGVRQQFAPGEQFQLRGDIGGFGTGSKFSWQTYGVYSHDFTFMGLNLTSTLGYRALSVNYSTGSGNRQNGISAVIHGPVTGLAIRF